MFTISELDFLRQLDEGNVVGEGAWVPVGVNDGIGGLRYHIRDSHQSQLESQNVETPLKGDKGIASDLW